MWQELMQRSRMPWAVTILVPGVILVLAMGMPWKRQPISLASHATPAMHPGTTPAWNVHIRNMDSAIGQGAVRAAEASWLVAQMEAQRSPTWEAWIGVGDAALRLGDAARSRPTFITRARRAYRKAILTAYEQRSQAGVLAAAHAFAALGDEPLADDLRALARTLPPPGA